MFVEILLDVFLVGVGDGNVFLAEDNTETVYQPNLRHVDNVGTMGAQKLWMGQVIFQFLHVRQERL